LGFIFLPPKGGGNNRDKADAEKYAALARLEQPITFAGK